jgi:hypothetical protein
MKSMNTVFTAHLGVETRSSFQSQCHAIETLAMQPRRAAEEPNSQSVLTPQDESLISASPLVGDACIDGAIVPSQLGLVDVGASNDDGRAHGACIDGATVPSQLGMADVGASKRGRAHNACIDGATVSGQSESVDVGASAYACIDSATVPGQPGVADVGASVAGGTSGEGRIGEGGGGTGWGYLYTVLKLMRASIHPAEGSWQTQRKIGQRLRGARGAG